MTQVPLRRNFKICLVSISLAKGGAERSCAMLSQMLDQLGHEVHIAILNNEIDYPYAGTLFNLGDLKKKKESLLDRFIRIKKLRNFLKDNHFDVVIDHRSKNNFRKELFYANYIYKGIKRIYVVHSANPSLYLTEKPIKFARICRDNLFNIAVSKHIEEVIFSKMAIANSATIYNAFDPKWKNSTGEVPKEISDKKYILSYGRIDDAVKDLTFLITSFSSSSVWKENGYLVILGEGEDLKMLTEFAVNQEASRYILFLPFTPSPFSIIKKAHIVTLTSKFEGFPMVLIESLSLGTPVVSLDIVSGPSEIITDQHNGLLVAERNINDFSDAIASMCFNEELYTNCKSNALESVRQFSMEHISQKWDEILQEKL